eukprot:TRINITY_DN321_c0_g1_i1.p2 TRINITY_DN321_c0_g1~~TRINITY_DN321_c0_g1_i1.p2  ORF type:complete len:107 (+),score=28.51 TRINITY_DN321_c0_g1_i1:319-639(+)
MPTLAPQQLLSPEIDCESHIGSELYTFYFPIEIGDFVVSLWSKSTNLYSVTLYENGTQVSPRDARLGSWMNKLRKSWKEDVFTKRELDQIVGDLKSISSTSSSSSL